MPQLLPDRYLLSTVTKMRPLGKACKKCMADQKQKNVKKVPGVSVCLAVVYNNQSGEAAVVQEVTGLTVNGEF